MEAISRLAWAVALLHSLKQRSVVVVRENRKTRCALSRVFYHSDFAVWNLLQSSAFLCSGRVGLGVFHSKTLINKMNV